MFIFFLAIFFLIFSFVFDSVMHSFCGNERS
jgi:hypothetical protein